MLDAAYTLPASIKTTKKSNTVVIGLSLHAWQGQELAVTKLLRHTLHTLAKNHSLRVLLIPHHLLPNADSPDTVYMQKVLHPLSSKITITQPSVQELQKKQSKTAQYIKQLTADVDLLITSRYHGIIFACSTNVPTVALNYDHYYSIKNNGALQTFYGDNFTQYCVSSNPSGAYTDLLHKTQLILKHLHKEKKILRIHNDKIRRAQKIFNTFLIE